MDKLEKKILYKIGKANKEFKLIEKGDRIMVGLSGGKDSWSLLHLLNILRQKLPYGYDLMAVTIHPGFEGFQTAMMERELKEKNYKYHIEKTCILDIIKEKIKKGTYCSFCSRLRRANLYDLAKRFNCNKIALAHHMDDFIETLLLNQFFIGKIKAMSPKLYADDGVNIIIRPLVYIEEKDIIEYSGLMKFPLITCNCPGCGSHNSKRLMIKNVLLKLQEDIPDLKKSLIKSLTKVEVRHLMDNKVKNMVMGNRELTQFL